MRAVSRLSVSKASVLALSPALVWGVMMGLSAQGQAAPTNPLTTESNVTSARLAKKLAAVGDLNGDGYADLLATANGLDNGDGTRTELVYLYYGSPTGLVTPPGWTYTLTNVTTDYDAAIAGAGDVNNDGYPDFIIGAPNALNDKSEINSGRVLVFLGSNTGPVDPPALDLVTTSKSSQTGYSVAGVGDVNNDGYDDIAYGAPFAESTTTEANEGRLYLHYGTPEGVTSTAVWIADSNQKGAQLGCGLSGAGDVNGDGFADILAGACFLDNGETDEGQVRVYLGSPSGPPAAADWMADGGSANLYSGAVVASAGDFNGDGFDDVLVSISAYDGADGTLTDSGIVRLYAGSATGPSTTETWSYSPAQKTSLWAQSLIGHLDLTGDDVDDVLMGSGYYDVSSARDAGRVSLLEGSTRRLPTEPTWNLDSTLPTELFGSSMARVGDVTGDGCAELAIGAPGFTGPEASEGRIYLYTADSHDQDGDGFCSGDSAFADCNDTNASAYPGATEIPGNGSDDNCDGKELCYVDSDLDGFYDPAVATVESTDISCTTAGLLPATTGATDCDDSKDNVYPGATETCDYLDNDCDSAVDEGVTTPFYVDADNDGYGSTAQVIDECTQPTGYVADATDCDDNAQTIHPNADELPNDGVDQDCDTQELCYADQDNDGFRPDVTSTVTSEDLDCDDVGEAIATDPAGDCNDESNVINPSVQETCDGVDNNCNNVFDDGTSVDCPTGDFDGDGFTEQAGDCNDQAEAVFPNATEVCNSVDDNCNVAVDEDDVCATPTPDTDGTGCSCSSADAAPRSQNLGWVALMLVALPAFRRRRVGHAVPREP